MLYVLDWPTLTRAEYVRALYALTLEGLRARKYAQAQR